MRSARQLDMPMGGKLTRTAPGLYVDETGAEYFYLTGMYPVIAQCLGQNHLLNTPASLVDILGELRTELSNVCRVELVD